MQKNINCNKKKVNWTSFNSVYIITPIAILLLIGGFIFFNAKEKDYKYKTKDIESKIETLIQEESVLKENNNNLKNSSEELDKLIDDLKEKNN